MDPGGERWKLMGLNPGEIRGAPDLGKGPGEAKTSQAQKAFQRESEQIQEK